MHDTNFVEAADRIGARLCRDAIWSDRRCNWLGWALEVVGRSYSRVFRAQSAAIYDGTAGIALFLGRLSSITGDAIQRATAIGALNQALDALPDLPAPVRSSLYSGATGIAYAAIELGRLLEIDAFSRRGLADLERAAAIADGPAWLDILGGSAGTIQALLAVDLTHRGQPFRDLADRHGRRLVETARRTDRGWSWDTLPGQSSDHPLGYGHGAGGIGSALLALWAATAHDEYRHGALEAFRYERAFLDRARHNWPDFRVPAATPDQAVYSAAWCHGGPGVGLSRVRALDLIDDREVANDLDEAIELTVALCRAAMAAPSSDLCLCHGLGGNADLLIEAAAARERPELHDIAEQAARPAIDLQHANDLPWTCGVNGGGETPNLMLGLAGIGHFFLRLYDPVRTPSILALEAARTATGAVALETVAREAAVA